MRILLTVLMATLAITLAGGCSHEQVSAPPEQTATAQASDLKLDPDQVASEIILATGWDLADDVDPPIQLELLENKVLPRFLFGFERTVLMEDIVHYSFEIQIGDGPYEKIRLHRVVKERRPFQPST